MPYALLTTAVSRLLCIPLLIGFIVTGAFWVAAVEQSSSYASSARCHSTRKATCRSYAAGEVIRWVVPRYGSDRQTLNNGLAAPDLAVLVDSQDRRLLLKYAGGDDVVRQYGNVTLEIWRGRVTKVLFSDGRTMFTRDYPPAAVTQKRLVALVLLGLGVLTVFAGYLIPAMREGFAKPSVQKKFLQ